MRTLLTTLFSIALTFTVISQKSATQNLTSFENLKIVGNFPVTIVESDQNIAEVETFSEDADIEKLNFSYSGNTLTIKYSGSFVKEIDMQLTLYCSYPITSIDARRGVTIQIPEVVATDRAVEYLADAGSKILIHNITAATISTEIRKGGSIQLIGKTEKLNALVRAGGTIAAANLKARDVKAEISLGGEIICAPIEKLDAKITSGGTISYKGNPSVTQTIKLGGKIEQL